MRSPLLSIRILVCLSFLAALVVGCGSPASGAVEEPDGESVGFGVEVAALPGPDVFRVGGPSVDRLDFDGNVAPTPSPSISPRALRQPRTPVPANTPVPRLTSVQSDLDSSAGCEALFRSSLVSLPPEPLFGAEVVSAAVDTFVVESPSCLAEGWDPVVGLQRVCHGLRVGGLLLPEGLTTLPEFGGQRSAGVTGRDESGNLLIHFEAVPFESLSGCWFYDSSREIWGWSLSDGREGIDRVIQSACDEELRRLILQFDVVDAELVSEVMLSIRQSYPLDCDARAWSQFPSLFSHGDCRHAGPTGRFEDGSILINWLPGYLASDGSVCWYWDPEDDFWLFSFEPSS